MPPRRLELSFKNLKFENLRPAKSHKTRFKSLIGSKIQHFDLSGSPDELIVAAQQKNKITVSVALPAQQCNPSVTILNPDKGLIRILWDKSSLSFAGANNLRPIPMQQISNNSSVAPSSATATVITPNSKYSDGVLALENISTQTSYSSLYQGINLIGTVANGTYIGRGSLRRCTIDDVASRDFQNETEAQWLARLKSEQEKRYLGTKFSMLLTLEINGAEFPLLFSAETGAIKIIETGTKP